MSNIYVLGLCLSCIRPKDIPYVDQNTCFLLQDMYGAIVLETMEMLKSQVKHVRNTCQKAQIISQIN
jgi:hypothetical protein